MSKKYTIIEINGQRYDASTGTLLSGELKRPKQNIDGILAPIDAPEFLMAAEKLAPEKEPLVNLVTKPTMSDVVRDGVNIVPKRNTQNSRTLMRHVVKKPGPTLKRQLKVQGAPSKVAKKTPSHAITVKSSASKMNPTRAARAQKAIRSEAVSRFKPASIDDNASVVVQLAVPEFLHHRAPAISAASTQKALQPPTTNDILAHALHIANSHDHPLHPKKRRVSKHATLIISAFVFAMVVTGAYANNNASTVKMYVASAKAGFSASLPGYQPPGYRLSEVSSTAGVVGVNYLSNSDDRSFSLIQKQSNWDSETLRYEFVSKKSEKFQTVETAGRIIYVYGDNQATWVSGGIWYQLQTNGSLSTRQVIDLAKSL